MRFSADTNLQRIVFGGFGLKILCLTKQSLCFLSIAWIFEKQIGNEVFQNWCYIRHVHSWYALTYVLLLRLLVLSSKVKFHFSSTACMCVCTCLCMCAVWPCHHVRQSCMLRSCFVSVYFPLEGTQVKICQGADSGKFGLRSAQSWFLTRRDRCFSLYSHRIRFMELGTGDTFALKETWRQD